MTAPKFEKPASASRGPVAAHAELVRRVRGGGRVAGGAWIGVVVGAVVPGGDHVQRARVALDRIVERRGGALEPDAGVCHLRVHGARVHEAVGDRGDGAHPLLVEHFHSQDPGPAPAAGGREAPCPRHAEVVVGARRDRAGDVRAVVPIGGRVVVVLCEVPASEIVDLAVAVVVDAVGPLAAPVFARIDEHVRRQVRMVRHDAAIHDGHPKRRPEAGAKAPALGGIDVGIRCAGDVVDLLPRVLEAPEAGEPRVVGSRHLAHDRVRLGVEHVRVALELRRDLLLGALGHLHQLGAGEQQLALEAGIDGLARLRALGPRGSLLVAHDHLAGNDLLTEQALRRHRVRRWRHLCGRDLRRHRQQRCDRRGKCSGPPSSPHQSLHRMVTRRWSEVKRASRASKAARSGRAKRAAHRDLHP